MTTTVQFYHLLTTTVEQTVPKLMEKALASGARVVILARDAVMIRKLSEQLWSANPAGFLPHGGPGDAHSDWQPIYLTTTEENPNTASILVVLNGTIPAQLTRYQKLLDMVDGNDDAAVAAARLRWQHYQQESDVALQYIKQQPKGGWKIEMESGVTSSAA
jgi:DNA polymerase-3 subunit chi